MGASQVRTASGPRAGSELPPAGPAGLVEYAVGQLLHNGDAADALPAVLGRLAAGLGCHAVLAVQQTAARSLVVLAAHPQGAAADGGLMGELGELTAARALPARDGGSFEERLDWTAQPEGPPMSVLMAYSAAEDHCLCALALIGDGAGWTAEVKSMAHVIAAVIAAQIRHANDKAKLAEGQALTAALIEGSPDAIVVTGPDGRIVRFNPAAEALFDRRRADVLGQELEGLLLPERHRAEFAAGIRSYLESGDRGIYVGSMRHPAMRPDGTERMVELTPVPITVDGVVHFCGFMRDISELERAHAALADSEARFRVLAQLAPVGMVQMDAGGLCTFANDRWCELTGMTAADAAGIGWAMALHPEDAVRMEREWAVAAARGTELSTDCRLVSASGREIWVHAAAVPLLTAEGRPAGFLAAVTDVSARKRAEAEREQLLATERAARRSLADQTERLNSLISNAIPGIMVRDEHGRITQVNRSFCDLFGVTTPTGELVGTPAATLADRVKTAFADPADFLRRTSRLHLQRRPAEGEQFSCADGRTFEGDYWPVFAEGDYRGDLWLFWDISERKALEEQRDRILRAELAARDAAEQAQQRLAEQNVKLQELDEAKSEFLATMSHELRTPLTSIVSFIELVLDTEQQLAASTLDSLRIIRRNAERLLRLVGDLLMLSRAEAGVLSLDLGDVEVPELIDESVRAASASAAERGIRIESSVPDGPRLHADQLRLQQVLDNLLSNAVKFSRDGSRVTVTATHDEQTWRIDVTDQGIGIPPADLEQLFNRFVRASNAASAGLPGTGLGLSIVKAITELHGGYVEVRSVLGSGTTFSVYLPAGP
jgi:PAS domain S-box-containing protein